MTKPSEKVKITALYERLSHDDERAGESVSIENQKRILEDYALKKGFTNIVHFTDDGVRGTTFKRPGLDAMLNEIRAGNVATVIIKDQSRIGRDVVEVGQLIRQAETDPEAAAVLAKMRADQCAAVTKSRQKMCEEAANGNPEAILRYEKHLAMRRENYRNRKNNKEVPA